MDANIVMGLLDSGYDARHAFSAGRAVRHDNVICIFFRMDVKINPEDQKPETAIIDRIKARADKDFPVFIKSAKVKHSKKLGHYVSLTCHFVVK